MRPLVVLEESWFTPTTMPTITTTRAMEPHTNSPVRERPDAPARPAGWRRPARPAARRARRTPRRLPAARGAAELLAPLLVRRAAPGVVTGTFRHGLVSSLVEVGRLGSIGSGQPAASRPKGPGSGHADGEPDAPGKRRPAPGAGCSRPGAGGRGGPGAARTGILGGRGPSRW